MGWEHIYLSVSPQSSKSYSASHNHAARFLSFCPLSANMLSSCFSSSEPNLLSLRELVVSSCQPFINPPFTLLRQSQQGPGVLPSCFPQVCLSSRAGERWGRFLLLWAKADLKGGVSGWMGRDRGLDEKTVRPVCLIWNMTVQAL